MNTHQTPDELVLVFEMRAEHERQLAAAFRIGGKYAAARRHDERGEAFDEAAAVCRGDYGRVVDWMKDDALRSLP